MVPPKSSGNARRVQDDVDAPPEPPSNPPAPEPAISDLVRLMLRFQEQLDAMQGRLDQSAAPSRTPTPHPSDDTPPGDPPVAPVTPKPVNSAPDAKVAAPNRFSGKSSEFLNFMMQCELTFEMRPNTYPPDDPEKRVLFIISNLDGNALRWARDIFQNRAHPYRRNYEAFRQALYDMYEDRSFLIRAEDRLATLRQMKSASQYAVEFQSAAAPLDYGNNALCGMFYKGLKPDVKRSLIIQGRAARLPDLISQAITLDQQLHYAHIEEKRLAADAKPHSDAKSHYNSKPGSTKSPDKPERRFDNSDRKKPRHDNQPPRRYPSLSPEERERYKRERRCFRCGRQGHMHNECPKNPRPENVHAFEPWPATPPTPATPLSRPLYEPSMRRPNPIYPSHVPVPAHAPVPAPPVTSDPQLNWTSLARERSEL